MDENIFLIALLFSLAGFLLAFTITGLVALPMQIPQAPAFRAKAKLFLRSAALASTPGGIIGLCVLGIYVYVMWNVQNELAKANATVAESLAASGQLIEIDAEPGPGLIAGIFMNPVFLVPLIICVMSALMLIPAVRRHWVPFLLLMIPSLLCSVIICWGLFESVGNGIFGGDDELTYSLLFFFAGMFVYFSLLALFFAVGYARGKKNSAANHFVPPSTPSNFY